MSHHCPFCGHKHLTAKTTRYIHQQADELLIVDEVPCLECDYCGEPYFDAAVLKAIEAEHTANGLGTRRRRKALRRPAAGAGLGLQQQGLHRRQSRPFVAGALTGRSPALPR
jgi:YgiT-type zinc finger domain-containing protein